MRNRLAPLALAAVLVAGLTGCASPAAVDEESSELSPRELEVLAASQDGFLGSGTFQFGEQEWVKPDEIVLSYESPVRVDGVTFACFGGATVRAGYTLRVGSSWLGGESVEVECDGVADTTPLSDPVSGVNAVQFTGALVDGNGAVLVSIVSGEGAVGDDGP